MHFQRYKRLLFFVTLLLVFSIARPSAAIAASQVNYKQGLTGTVCLTIDDGYGSDTIRKALNILRARQIKCTFFVVGSRLKATPDLWRQAVRDGHEICYHSMSHRTMSYWSNAAILQDVRQWNQTAKSVLGQDYAIPKFARLPGGSGHKDARIQALFNSIGYKLIYWSADTYTGVVRKGTYNLNRRIADYIKRTTTANSIILIHFNSYDISALPGYIDWLKSRYRLGRVSDAFLEIPIMPKLPKLPRPPGDCPPPIFYGQ